MTDRNELIEGILHSFHAIRNIIKARSGSLGQQNNITHTQWFVLKIIEHFQSRSVKDISEMFGITSSASTQLVDGLVKSGLVTRKEDPRDRRSVRLELSQKGKEHIAASNENRINEMVELFDPLTDSELEEYLRLQKKILSKSLHND